MMMTMKDAQ